MNRNHIALFGLSLYGHVKPTLGLVAELVRRGHRVSYFVGEQYADLVAETGARPVTHQSRMHEYSMPLTAHDTVLAFSEESFAPLPGALAHLTADPPDLVAHDVLIGDTARIVARRFGVPTVRLYPGFGGNDRVPLDKVAEPDEPVPPLDIDHPMFGGVDLTHPDFPALEQRIDRLIELAGGEELLADHGEPLPREGALNIAFVPREFQIRAEEFDDSFVFAGPGIRPSEFTGDWTPPADGRPVVLVSLGTTTNKRPEVFRTLLDGLRDQPWRVVVTIGRDGDAAALEPVPDIVEIHRWLDQHSVLRHASLFVNQGGVGSVMQGLYWGVPQVLVTADDDTALAGHQIVQLGLGKQIHTDDLTPELLRDSAVAVLSDHTIAGAARAMSEHVRRPGAEDAADRVEALCNQQEVAVR